MRRPYRKLNLDERRILATMLQAKATKTKIAETLGRDRSTIHRDIKAITDEDMKVICDRLNNTPRKCLGWKTPSEVFREKMMEEMGKAPYSQKQ